MTRVPSTTHLWVLGLFVCLILQGHTGWQESKGFRGVSDTSKDSVAYYPLTGLYFKYKRDSLGAWQISRIYSTEDYIRHREKELLSRTPLLSKQWTSSPITTKKSSPFNFDLRGEASFKVGGVTIEDEDPSLPILMRKRSYADILYRTNLVIQAGYGEHLQLDVKYDTETALARNRASLALKYQGDKFDPIERVEAGHIDFQSRNPLIGSATDLFGIRGDFKVGNLGLTAFASRQHDTKRKIVLGSGNQGMQPFEWKSSEYQFARHFFLSELFASTYDARLSTLPVVQSDLLVERIEVWVTQDSKAQSAVETVPVFASPTWAVEGEAKDDFITLPSAKLLPEGAYTFSPSLGFLSLKVPLGRSQRLAVAYRYTLGGETHQVGTFVSDGAAIQLALLSDDLKTPQSPLWGLMMKNGYSLPVGGESDFTLQILYRDPSTGIEQVEASNGTTWLTAFGLDRSNTSGVGGNPDGVADNLPGVLVLPNYGTLFLPYRYPFLTVPPEELKYPDLYDRSPYEATKVVELDRFILKGEASGQRGTTFGDIDLGSLDLTPGSVTLRSRSGRTYTEGVDFIVDYSSGRLRITTPIDEAVEVSIQERERTRSKERNMLGLEATYLLTPSLSLTGSLLHYYEDSPFEKLRLGQEPLQQTLYGIDIDYSSNLRNVTSWLKEKFSGSDLSGESRLDLSLSYAHLKSGYATNGEMALEDFDTGGQTISLMSPSFWKHGSSPYIGDKKENNRGLLTWYSIDPLLTREGIEGQPPTLSADRMGRANPLVREVEVRDLFPSRDQMPTAPLLLYTMNLSYYPEERGIYTTPEASHVVPQNRWGTISFPLQVRDFKSAKIAYLEGWFIDPYSLDPNAPVGMLTFDLGRISEDLLIDGRAAYEGATLSEVTKVGQVPILLPNSYTFDRTGTVPMSQQDKGLDGMNNDEERHLLGVSDEQDLDPYRDDYRFYLDPLYEQQGTDILGRYKQINGTEGNAIQRTIVGREAAATWEPDREDLDGNFSLDTEDAFFRYSMRMNPDYSDYIVASREVNYDMPDGSSRVVKWLKFRIPLSQPTTTIGNPSMEDIRTVRLSLFDYERTLHLRVAELRLVASSWQVYDRTIDEHITPQAVATLTRLGVEEDSSRTPIPYVSPPNVVRNSYQSAMNLVRQDEQALSLSFDKLHKGEAVALFHNPIPWDLRHFETLSMFVHLESEEPIIPGDLEVFIRLGSDFTENYYEVRYPLTPTPIVDYSGYSPVELSSVVWPDDNRLRVDLDNLVLLKDQRDLIGVPSSDIHGDGSGHYIKGYPTLSSLSSLLIGVRSRRDGVTKGEVWFNELSVSGAREMGGMAYLASGSVQLSDLLSFKVEGGKKEAGFGQFTEDIRSSILETVSHYNMQLILNPHKLFPQRFGLHAPIDLVLSGYGATPLYSPVETDRLYSIDMGGGGITQKKDFRMSLKDWGIQKDSPSSSRPLWDPSCFSFGYDLTRSSEKSPQYPSKVYRQMASYLTYDYRSSSRDRIMFSSEWNRVYRRTLLPSSTLSTLQTEWLWGRSLQLSLSPIQVLALGFSSKTTARVFEPFESTFLAGGDPEFRLFSSEILQSLSQLGETSGYEASSELSLTTPTFTKGQVLRPLSGTISYRNSFRWQKGVTAKGGLSSGHYATGLRTLEGRLSYDFTKLLSMQFIPRVGAFTLHGRYAEGGELPGLLSTAGKAFGVPSLLFYELGITSPSSEIEHGIRKGLFRQNQDSQTTLYTPSFYHQLEAESALTTYPFKGLELRLSLAYRQEEHTTLNALTGESMRQSSSLRMSVWGLKDLFYNSFGKEGYSSPLFTSLLELFPNSERPAEAFLNLALSGSYPFRSHGLPSLCYLRPNWQARYNFVELIPRIKSFFPSLVIEHGYKSILEVPLFDRTKASEAQVSGLRSLTVLESLDPLVGISITTPFGLSLSERYNKRKSFNFLLSSLRLLEQSDEEISSKLSFSFKYPALFRSYFPLFADANHELKLTINHLYTKSYLLNRDIEKAITTATQGLKTHRVQVSADYAFSQAFTVRAYYELTARTPMVTNYNYPFRQTSYGLIFLLNLR